MSPSLLYDAAKLVARAAPYSTKAWSNRDGTFTMAEAASSRSEHTGGTRHSNLYNSAKLAEHTRRMPLLSRGTSPSTIYEAADLAAHAILYHCKQGSTIAATTRDRSNTLQPPKRAARQRSILKNIRWNAPYHVRRHEPSLLRETSGTRPPILNKSKQ